VTGFTIRPEQSGDGAAIHDLVKRSFAPMLFSGGGERQAVDRYLA
jgi:predicted N-acetyltransferase YhbS